MNPIHLHPMLVHFPIALVLVALLADLFSYVYTKNNCPSRAALVLLILGTLGALASVLSGYLFTKPTAGLADVVKELHALYAVVTTVILVITSVLDFYVQVKLQGDSKLKYAVTLLLLLAAVMVSLTGMKGGSIVYDIWLF